MLPEGKEVMRRAACGDVCPATTAAPTHAPLTQTQNNRTSDNKEILRQQLLSTSKERAKNAELTKQTQARNRQKNKWKLKFHHQALPQEYLDHYEQSLLKSSKQFQLGTKQNEKPKSPNFKINNFSNWAHNLTGILNDKEAETVPRVTPVLNMANKTAKGKEDKKKRPATTAPSKIVTYKDLPYMGEMTLNISKPQRGRKPKKADICHLIYENYGTVVPGQPILSQDRLNPPNVCKPLKTENLPSRTELQNKIITSLLERKLSLGNKRRLETLSSPRFNSPDDPMPEAPLTVAGPLHSDDEPLNLCIRDLRDLKIQIQKKFGNIYTSIPEENTEIEVPEKKSLKSVPPNAISVIQRNTNMMQSTASSLPYLFNQHRTISPTLSEPEQSTVSHESGEKQPGYVYWPNAGMYMHAALRTQLLYFQRLAAAGQTNLPSEDYENVPNTSCSISENQTVQSKPSSPSINEGKDKLVLKQILELLDPMVAKPVDEVSVPDQSIKIKRASPNPTQCPIKRKRSAIFIPPMPIKTSSSAPTTEVSICKFKFTGGSKPSLQEKKMLSVDSGGNFRYYSDTGNKVNKGYEYLPRDSNKGRNQDSNSEHLASIRSNMDVQTKPPKKEDLIKKKKKSRKTLQREKLEQTFKEKGFLIQTQQLQSAEGATYCKFRQLRKFTRYLFRSWKDYLPGELKERQPDQQMPQ